MLVYLKQFLNITDAFKLKTTHNAICSSHLFLLPFSSFCCCCCCCCCWVASVVSNSVHGISRLEHWRVLPFPSPGDLTNPGVEPGSPALQVDSLSSESPGKPRYKHPEQKIFFRDSHTFQKFLTKRGPLEEGMANHFSILALGTPWTVWKGKKIGHRKMNSPGQ